MKMVILCFLVLPAFLKELFFRFVVRKHSLSLKFVVFCHRSHVAHAALELLFLPPLPV